MLRKFGSVQTPSRTARKWCMRTAYVGHFLLAVGFLILVLGGAKRSIHLFACGAMTLSLGWAFTKLWLAIDIIARTRFRYEIDAISKLFDGKSPGKSTSSRFIQAIEQARHSYWDATWPWGGERGSQGYLWLVMLFGVIILPLMLLFFLRKVLGGSSVIFDEAPLSPWLFCLYWVGGKALIVCWRWEFSRSIRHAKNEANQCRDIDYVCG